MPECDICGRDDFASKKGLSSHQTQFHERGASKTELEADIQRVAELLSVAPYGPSKREYNEHGEWTAPTVVKRYETWNKAVESAGFELRHRPLQGAVESECEYCGSTLHLPKWEYDRYDNHFCRDGESRRGYSSCYEQYRSENYCGEWTYNYRGGGSEYYGPKWYMARKCRLEHDGWACQDCGKSVEESIEEYGFSLEVHHRIPADDFEDIGDAHFQANLITLCRGCHAKWERLPIQPIGNHFDPEEFV